jgi:hypothetical protein
VKKYTALEMHQLLLRREPWNDDPIAPDRQALHCPYFTRIRGALAPDWGVIINPESSRFGLLTFEHDACGCGPGSHETGNQRTDQWRDRRRERDGAPGAAGSSETNEGKETA